MRDVSFGQYYPVKSVKIAEQWSVVSGQWSVKDKFNEGDDTNA